MLFLVAALTFVGAQAATPGPMMLRRTFVKGLRSEYSVDADLEIEAREGLLQTFLPEEMGFKYSFYTTTTAVDSSIASMRYARPTMTEIAGATADSDPIPKTEKIDQSATFQLSPINEVLDFRETTPKKKKPTSDTSSIVTPERVNEMAQESVLDFIGPFIDDLERLSVFIGGADSSLDLEPKLNLDPVKVGDTWKRTVGFEPQKLSSKAGKTVVQRLDLTYTYKGLTESRGKQVQRISAELKLDTDLGKYVNDLFNATPENTGLKSIPTKMTIDMEFDLDPATLQTLYATVKSQGSFKIFAVSSPQAVVEQNINGTSVMKLVSNKVPTAPHP